MDAKGQAQQDAEARTERSTQSMTNSRVMFEAASRAVLDSQGKIKTLLWSLNGLQCQLDVTSDAKKKSEEGLLGLHEEFTALREELEGVKSIIETKGQAIDAPTKEPEKDPVVTPEMTKLLSKLQADLDAANSSQAFLKSELDTEKARLKMVKKEKDDLEKSLAVEHTQRSEAESKIQELTIELTDGSIDVQNLRSHAQLVEAAFQKVERDSKSVLGLWLKCRIVRCLFQSSPSDTTSVDDVLRHNATETERLLLGMAWDKIISQEAHDQSTEDQEQALFDVFSDCAHRLPDQGRVFPCILEGDEVGVCFNLLSGREVVIVIKMADCTLKLWHSHVSNCTTFAYRWRSWLRLDQGPQIYPIHIQVHERSEKEITGWLKGIFDTKMLSRDDLNSFETG